MIYLTLGVEALRVSNNGRCGSDYRMACTGSSFGRCCSQDGYVPFPLQRALKIDYIFPSDTVEVQGHIARQRLAKKNMDIATKNLRPRHAAELALC
jgi:hypothetical protein